MKHLHPFPARMAPEVALERVRSLPDRSTVLDPMIGSGTVPRAAAEHGINALGVDLDPMALLISKVSTCDICSAALENLADYVLNKAEEMKEEEVKLPWIDGCKETSEYVKYWFSEKQQGGLRRLAFVLAYDDEVIGRPDMRNALLLAMSRIIITKEPQASLARDTSRSRPHKIKGLPGDYDVMANYRKSVRKMAGLLKSRTITGHVQISKGDARDMHMIESDSVDSIITSPPYLNAIDYMRGHRIALVWMGHSIPALREINQSTVGTEIGKARDSLDRADAVSDIYGRLDGLDALEARLQKMVKRYIDDMIQVLREAHRVLKPGGDAVYVVGDSCLRGVFIKNSRIIEDAAERAGFSLEANSRRDIPINHRSLPFLLKRDKSNSLNKRMRYEQVMTFRK